MEISTLNQVIKQVGRTLDRNSPTILTALSVAGLITTVVMAVKATPKALELIELEEDFRKEQLSDDRPLDIPSLIETTWRIYLPSIVVGGITIVCIVGANHISLRRNAALVSLLSIAETTAKEYQTKVIEQLGEKKEEKIRDEIAQDHLNEHPAQNKPVIFTGKGDYLCFDDFSKRYFRSDIEAIRRAENNFNHQLIKEGWMDINELYYEFGLDPIELGDQYGWIADQALLDLTYSTKMAKDTQEPCLVISYKVVPKHI